MQFMINGARINNGHFTLHYIVSKIWGNCTAVCTYSIEV